MPPFGIGGSQSTRATRKSKASPRFKRRSRDPITIDHNTGEILFKPHDYQVEGIKWLLQDPMSGLFWPPGLGKTAVTLAAFHVRRKKHPHLRMLVVAKRRICHRVWPREIEKWGFPYTCSVLHGNRAALEDDADIHCINYESLPWLVEHVAPRRKSGRVASVRYHMLVVDESSQIRNSRTRRFKLLRRMMNKFDYRVILTGSPAPRGLMGIWSQMFICDGGELFGGSIVRYRNRFFYPCGFKGKEYELQEDGEDRIHELLRQRILHVGHSVLANMPKAVFINSVIDLPPDVMLKYHLLEEDFLVELRAGEVVDAPNAGVASGKLRQMANGAVYLRPEVPVDAEQLKKLPRRVSRLHQLKAERLLEIVEEVQGTPVLVAVEFHHDRDAINEVFGYEVPYIGGGTSDDEANQLEDEWNAGNIPVLLGQPASIAHGLNLQDAGNIVVFYSQIWNLEEYEQFYQRVLRQGQKAGRVFIYHIVAADTVDLIILHAMRARGAVQDRLFKALEHHYGDRMAKKKVNKKVARKRAPLKVPASLRTKVKGTKAFDPLVKLATAGKAKCFPVEVHSDGTLAPHAVANWWLGLLQALGAATVTHHTALQKALLDVKHVVTNGDLGDCYRFSKAAVQRALDTTIGDDGTIVMKDPELLLQWSTKRDIGPKEGERRMAKKKVVTKKKAQVTKKKAGAVTKKKAAAKKKASGKAMGVYTPLGTADWNLVPDTSKVKVDNAKVKETPPPAPIQAVLDLAGGRQTTVGKLKEEGAPKSRLWACLNRGYLVVK